MRPSTIRYFLKEGFSGLKKNLLMTVASIIAVAACISIMSFSYCVVSNLQYMLDQMEDSIGISVFLKGDLTSEDIENMKTTISGLDHVTNVTYISPADALDQLKEQWGADEDIFIGLDDTNNPLSHSFQVELDQIESQDAVLAELQKIEGVDKVEYGQSLSEMLMSVSNVFQVAGILVMLVLGVISVMIIINTIRISVMNRRVEINIMKYVGATDWFIRWPFIIEGIIIGLIGAILPMLVGMPMYGKTVSLFYSHIPFVENFVRFRVVGDVFSFVLPAALIFGILLGVVGSVTSIRKHLQV
ncbi:permease-like cell division protein FtsX [Anaerotignum lactatifermentans]|uniref:permease-like cell division protein FtsX n=1 Tax=Anaerotignum lactatifermentans TaxID=160404 RepID=UPI00307A6C19